MANKKNWMTGAGVGPKNIEGPDEYYQGKSDSDESGSDSGLSDGPNHLKSDTTLQAYINEIEKDYQEDYATSWDSQFHSKGNNYPSMGSKTKGGMD